MSDLTPQQRVRWRTQAEESVKLNVCDQEGRHVLALLDALSAVEARVARVVEAKGERIEALKKALRMYRSARDRADALRERVSALESDIDALLNHHASTCSNPAFSCVVVEAIRRRLTGVRTLVPAPGSDPGAATKTSTPCPTYHCTLCDRDHGGDLDPAELPCKEYAAQPAHRLGECKFSTGAYYPTFDASVKTPAPRTWTRAGSMSLRCGACGAEGVYQIKDGEIWISWDPVTP